MVRAMLCFIILPICRFSSLYERMQVALLLLQYKPTRDRTPCSEDSFAGICYILTWVSAVGPASWLTVLYDDRASYGDPLRAAHT